MRYGYYSPFKSGRGKTHVSYAGRGGYGSSSVSRGSITSRQPASVSSNQPQSKPRLPSRN